MRESDIFWASAIRPFAYALVVALALWIKQAVLHAWRKRRARAPEQRR